ncbi:hypothetical protein JTB14_015102 [Gonioctena quinquepunctata]|nr:hypothetical protein JTB14_015102 [Gonioctena quinquepunctata]
MNHSTPPPDDLKEIINELSRLHSYSQIPFDNKDYLKYYSVVETGVFTIGDRIIFSLDLPLGHSETSDHYHLYLIPNQNQSKIPPASYLSLSNEMYQYQNEECIDLQPNLLCKKNHLDCKTTLLSTESKIDQCLQIPVDLSQEMIREINQGHYIGAFPESQKLQTICEENDLEYGEDVWKQALHLSGCKHTEFNTHQVYPDDIMTSLASSLASITSKSYESFMIFFGRCFVRFFSNYGYDATIKATGRYFADFLDSVDNIHSQFRLSYPKMKSPSMYLTDVDVNGGVLVYRSHRQGLTHYVMGQLEEIAEDIFNLELKTTIVHSDIYQSSMGKDVTIVKLRLNFDNSQYVSRIHSISPKDPFHINDFQLEVRSVYRQCY